MLNNKSIFPLLSYLEMLSNIRSTALQVSEKSTWISG